MIFRTFGDHLEDWHCHDEMEFTVSLKGAFECGLNERRYRIEAGEGIFVNSGVLHMYRALGKYEDSESISIVFLPQFLSGGTENLIFHKFIEPVMEDAGMRGEPLRRGSGWQEELLVCLRRLYCLSRENGWLTEMRLRDQLSRAWELFLCNYTGEGEETERPSTGDDLRGAREEDPAVHTGALLRGHHGGGCGCPGAHQQDRVLPVLSEDHRAESLRAI